MLAPAFRQLTQPSDRLRGANLPAQPRRPNPSAARHFRLVPLMESAEVAKTVDMPVMLFHPLVDIDHDGKPFGEGASPAFAVEGLSFDQGNTLATKTPISDDTPRDSTY